MVVHSLPTEVDTHPEVRYADLTVTDVRPNVAVDIPVPDGVRQAASPYARVTTQMPADGVWYLAGGSHHSVAIEMKDHVIVVEGPLGDERALAVIAEVRKLSSRPIRYVIASHHHFDHSGGLRAFAAEGVTVIAHEASRAFFERTLAAPARISPDHLRTWGASKGPPKPPNARSRPGKPGTALDDAIGSRALTRSGRKGTVEGVRDKRVLTDGTRTVEIHHIAGNLHADDLLLVSLPREKFLIEADTYTPPPPNAPPAAVNPNSVHLADVIKRLGLLVDQILPLHGRIVPLADLHKAIGHRDH